MSMKKNVVLTLLLFCAASLACAELGTSFQWEKPERLEETEWQSRV